MSASVWDDLARKTPESQAQDPRPWDEDGLLELRHVTMANVTMARALAPLLGLGGPK